MPSLPEYLFSIDTQDYEWYMDDGDPDYESEDALSFDEIFSME